MAKIYDYKDGSVDVENSVILDENGVTKLEHPRTAQVAEFIGTVVSGAMLGFSIYIPPDDRETVLPPHRIRRGIGYGVLSSVAVIGLANCQRYM